MKLSIKIENLGKLSRADVQIRNFTVFAGPNNTGKTYVSKTLYSILDAMKAEYIGEVSRGDFFHAREALDHLMRELPATVEGKEDFAAQVKGRLEKMNSLFKLDQERSFDRKIERINSALEGKKKLLSEIISLSENLSGRLPAEKDRSRALTAHWLLWTSRLKCLLENTPSAEAFLNYELSGNFSRNLRSNFPVDDVSLLRRHGAETATISCEELGEFRIGSSASSAKSSLENMRKFQEFSELVYLDSPTCWKVKDALEAPRFRGKRALGVPQHFYDLMAALRETKDAFSHPAPFFHEPHGNLPDTAVRESLISDAAPDAVSGQMGLFQKLHEDITKTIGGKLVVSDDNELLFRENGNELPLSIVATGVVNYGMLGLLIEKGTIDGKTFLFMDEPEAHLNPTWQVKMAKTLFGLAELGTHVIITTHSTTILKWLEVEVKNNPKKENIIALNHFSTEGETVDYDNDFLSKLAGIKAELTRPYYHLYLQER